MCSTALSFPGSRTARVVFRTDTLERSGGKCGERGTPCVTVRVEYPLCVSVPGNGSSESLNRLIQEVLLGKFDPQGVESVLNDVLIEEMKLYDARDSNSSHQAPWRIDRTISIVGDTLGILTFSVTESRRTGTESGIPMCLLYMVNEADTKVLSLDDVIIPGTGTQVTRYAEDAFRRSRGLSPEDDLRKSGFTFPDGKFTLTMNVGLVAEGIMFYYNPTEIAGPEFGSTTVVVPWGAAKGLIRKK